MLQHWDSKHDRQNLKPRYWTVLQARACLLQATPALLHGGLVVVACQCLPACLCSPLKEGLHWLCRCLPACLCSPLKEGLHLLGSPSRQHIGNALAELAHPCSRAPLLLQSQAKQPLIPPPVPNPAETRGCWGGGYVWSCLA